MRRSILALAAAACLALAAPAMSGCATIAQIPGGSAFSPTADEKALFVAESVFKGALQTADAAVDAGVLKGEDAIRVRDILRQAKAALDAARTAYRVGDAAQTISKSHLVESLVAKIGPLAAAGPTR